MSERAGGPGGLTWMGQAGGEQEAHHTGAHKPRALLGAQVVQPLRTWVGLAGGWGRCALARAGEGRVARTSDSISASLPRRENTKMSHTTGGRPPFRRAAACGPRRCAGSTLEPFPPLTAAQRLTVGLQEPWRGGVRCARRGEEAPDVVYAPLPARSKYIFWAGSPLFMLKPSFDGGVQL